MLDSISKAACVIGPEPPAGSSSGMELPLNSTLGDSVSSIASSSSLPISIAAIVMGPAGFLAVIAGWITTEVGRQPWTVYGLLRTAESHSPLDAPAVAASLTAFVVVYAFVFGAGVFYLLRLMGKPPAPGTAPGGVAPSQDMTAIAGRVTTTKHLEG